MATDITPPPPGYTARADGMIIGPDGKPCKACNAFKGWTKVYTKGAPKTPAQSVTPDTSSSSNPASAFAALAGTAAAAATTTSPSPSSAPPGTLDCPADSLLLGRHTWTFLHTTASYYPPKPSPHHQSSMLGLLRALPLLYPCSPCATELGVYMKANPVEEAVKTREGVERWLCEAHNDVNVRLGKDKFDCDRVGERWRDGPSEASGKGCSEME